MSVKAKFRVESVTHNTSGGSIKLAPVTGGSAENESFFKYTPCGYIELGTINEAAIQQFKPGAEFFVEFTDASITKE